MRTLSVISFFGLVLSSIQFVHEYYPSSFTDRLKRDFSDSDLSDRMPEDVLQDPESSSTNHTYYQMNIHYNRTDLMSQYYVDVREWIKNSALGVNGSLNHEHLAGSYRKAAMTKIGFKFPFYGHHLENLTIATGGFCYVGNQTKSWLAATQYIAPLMANFGTTGPESTIMWASNSSRMVITWESVRLRDNPEAGNWTFQVSLFKNGDIWFVYKEIPIPVTLIDSTRHPCKIGISDAYLITRQNGENAPLQTKKIIHEYHRIEVPKEKVVNNTIVVLEAIPN